MIEIRHLKLVDAVSKVGSLTNAAERLFLTQSALSHQLKELENNLGVQVFYRINNQLHFTPAGKEFLEAGKEILGWTLFTLFSGYRFLWRHVPIRRRLIPTRHCDHQRAMPEG